MFIAQRVKMYPDEKQKELLDKAFYVNRYAYNYAFLLWNRQYKDFKRGNQISFNIRKDEKF
jgi:hypothetical protein